MPTMKKVIIVTFRTRSENFDSDYERSKFFRELHGWKQSVPSEKKKYTYRRPGLLDEIPHDKIADSVFMAMMEDMKRFEEFFDQWQEKVDYNIMKIMVERERFLRLLNSRENKDFRNDSDIDGDIEKEV
jgi:hypothetical protein